MSGKFALIVGNSRYDDASLGRLKAPDIDVHELESVLKSPEIGGFDEVSTLLNEECASVRKAIARFYDQRQRDDLLLLYFSGHGIKDEQGHLYLALRDTESGLLAGSAIETAFIAGRMDRSFSKRQVLVLDCCHSGAFAHGVKAAQGASVGTAEAFEGTGLGRVVLTATDSTQYAWEGDQIIGDAPNSLFTHFLIEGLKTGAADKDEDGVVTVDELYDYVREQVVTATPKQTPHKWSYLQRGDIVIAQNPFATRSVLPAEVEEAINSKLSGLRLEAVGHLEALLDGHDAKRAQAALDALKALALDDSRKVANAAAAVLAAHEQEAGRPVDSSPRAKATAAEAADLAHPSDIFISYAHEDQAKARALAGVLAARGWKVWWDRKIAPGEAYDVIIERELGTCKCAIVLWSAASVQATWVRNEARRAARRKVLLPILIDAVEMPLEFENLQAADLTSWKDTADDPELEAVVERILALSPIPEEVRARLADERARRNAREAARLEQESIETISRGAETARIERERAEAGHRAAEGVRVERARVEAAKREAEAARAERERAEAARRQAEAARVEQARLEAAKRDAEAARIERERAEAARQAEAARVEQARVEAAKRDAEAARVERERAEAARRQAEAARVEQARLEAAKRDAEAARIERERAEAARRQAEAARVERERAEAERAEAERIQRHHDAIDRFAHAPEPPAVDRHADVSPVAPPSITPGRVLMAATALVVLIAVTWFAGVLPRRAFGEFGGRRPPRPSIETTSHAPSSSETPRPKTPAIEQAGASTIDAGPAPKPVPDKAPTVTPPGAETLPKNQAEKLPAKKGSSRRLDDLRTLALNRFQSGAPREALNAAAEGLRIDAGDPALKNLLATLLRDAQASARRAREDAMQAGAELNAAEQFQLGVNRERESMRLQRAGRLDAATRGFWGAADQFTAAANESRDATRKEYAPADPEPRREKAPQSAPPPAPAQPRQKPEDRDALERPLVDQALRRYEAACASLSVDNVRNVYPSAPLDQLAKDFANSRSYVLTIQTDGYRFVYTDTLTAAIVAARISHDVTPKSGARGPKIEKAQTIQLEKQGANWIIRSIR
jgi:hypothetical protein